jgi:hypothetical protein
MFKELPQRTRRNTQFRLVNALQIKHHLFVVQNSSVVGQYDQILQQNLCVSFCVNSATSVLQFINREECQAYATSRKATSFQMNNTFLL